MRFSRRKVRADAGIRKTMDDWQGDGRLRPHPCHSIRLAGLHQAVPEIEVMRVGPYDREDKVGELPAVAPAAAEVLRLKTEYKSIRCRLRRVPRQCAATVQRNHFDEATDRKDRSRNR